MKKLPFRYTPPRGAISPIRIAIHQVNEARALIIAGRTKRARRKIRSAHRKLRGTNAELLWYARQLLKEALVHMIDYDNGTAGAKLTMAVELLVGVRS